MYTSFIAVIILPCILYTSHVTDVVRTIVVHYCACPPPCPRTVGRREQLEVPADAQLTVLHWDDDFEDFVFLSDPSALQASASMSEKRARGGGTHNVIQIHKRARVHAHTCAHAQAHAHTHAHAHAHAHAHT